MGKKNLKKDVVVAVKDERFSKLANKPKFKPFTKKIKQKYIKEEESNTNSYPS